MCESLCETRSEAERVQSADAEARGGRELEQYVPQKKKGENLKFLVAAKAERREPRISRAGHEGIDPTRVNRWAVCGAIAKR